MKIGRERESLRGKSEDWEGKGKIERERGRLRGKEEYS